MTSWTTQRLLILSCSLLLLTACVTLTPGLTLDRGLAARGELVTRP